MRQHERSNDPEISDFVLGSIKLSNSLMSNEQMNKYHISNMADRVSTDNKKQPMVANSLRDIRYKATEERKYMTSRQVDMSLSINQGSQVIDQQIESK